MGESEIISLFESAQLFKIVYACNAALFLYEVLLTIGDEIELMWTTKWGPATYLYAATRYSAIPEILLQIIFLCGSLSTANCDIVLHYTGSSIIIGMILGQGIIVLRTWAIWNGSRCITRVLVLMGVLSTAVIAYIVVEWASHTHGVSNRTFSSQLNGCSFENPYHLYYVSWVTFCCIDIAMICLTIVKYRGQWGSFLASVVSLWRGSPELTTSLYREAFTYFIAMLLFAIANLVLTFSVPPQYGVLFYCTERILYTSFACRVMLNLRAAVQRPVTGSTVETIATSHVLSFRPQESVTAVESQTIALRI